jgi:hypothetical protein
LRTIEQATPSPRETHAERAFDFVRCCDILGTGEIPVENEFSIVVEKDGDWLTSARTSFSELCARTSFSDKRFEVRDEGTCAFPNTRRSTWTNEKSGVEDER